MTKGLLAVLLAGAIGGCASSPAVQLDAGELQGVWILEALDGQPVEDNVNSAGTPWIEIDGAIGGSGGCNTFTMNSFELAGSELMPGDTFSTLAACLSDNPASDLMAAEEALNDVLGEDSISVEFVGSSMTWNAGGTELSFMRTDIPPED